MITLKERVLEKLQQQFKDSIQAVEELAGDVVVTVRKSDIVHICTFLRDNPELSFDCLRDVLGIDQYRPEERFEVVYNLYSLKNKHRFFLKVKVEESDPKVPTVAGVWPAANWGEREAYDMYGIIFEGHPDLRRIYMPEEFEYYPLRKEFPLMGIPDSLPLPRKS